MTVTVLTRDARRTAERASADGEDLWLPVEDLEPATGWELRPEGLCRDEICIPVYGTGTELVAERDGSDWLNFAGFARYIGQPYAHDDQRAAWYFGDGAAAAGARLQFLDAPDFELQDLQGRTHRLSDHRGKKIALALWASW